MPSLGHPVSFLSLSRVNVDGLRRDGTGQPVVSLQRKAKAYGRTMMRLERMNTMILVSSLAIAPLVAVTVQWIRLTVHQTHTHAPAALGAWTCAHS